MRYLVRHAPLKPPPATGQSRSQSARTSLATPSWLKRYYQYSKERFSLKEFVPLSIVVSLLAALGTQAYLYGRPTDIPAVAVSFAAVFLLFLRLRLVDELKDLEHDRQFYPGRPLPRGLIRPREVAISAAAVFLLEAIVATSGGTQSLGFFAIFAFYSFMTLKEFFIRSWLRRHFTIYVVSHELLVLPVCLYLFSLNGLTFSNLVTPYFWLLAALIASQLFLLEVTRKLRPKELEVASQDTYTARYGISASCILVGSLTLGVVASSIFATASLGIHVPNLTFLGLAILAPVASSLLAFARRPHPGTAKAVLHWSAGLVVATSALFILTEALIP